MVHDNESWGWVRSFNGRILTVVLSCLVAAGGFLAGEIKSQQAQDFEIRELENRVSSLEKIAAVNSEARIRTEEKLSDNRETLKRIEQLLEQHEQETKKRR